LESPIFARSKRKKKRKQEKRRKKEKGKRKRRKRPIRTHGCIRFRLRLQPPIVRSASLGRFFFCFFCSCSCWAPQATQPTACLYTKSFSLLLFFLFLPFLHHLSSSVSSQYPLYSGGSLCLLHYGHSACSYTGSCDWVRTFASILGHCGDSSLHYHYHDDDHDDRR
jgi:hypothetical protein